MRRGPSEEVDVDLEECPVTPKIVDTPMQPLSDSGAEGARLSAFYSARIEGLSLDLQSKLASNQLEIDVESDSPKSQWRRGRLAESQWDVVEDFASSRPETPNMQSLSSCSEAASSGPFYSARIEGLRELRSKLENQLEIDVESSRSHWTEVSTAATDDSDVLQVPNSVVFENLQEHPVWGLFFQNHQYELEIGAKIAEGGQAEIFEAFGMRKFSAGYESNYKKKKTSLVLKVFKNGFSLVDLQRSWPPGLAWAAYPHRFPHHGNNRQYGGAVDRLCWAMGVHLMDDGRFAFVFDRHWGDLRKLIDEQVLKRNVMMERRPPFDAHTTFMYIFSIAKGMQSLHVLGILHNDLKAANVLIFDRDYKYTTIADFESSMGTVGTGFWRAPEVLLALKNGDRSREPFTEKSDVYSFAMTCYEVITGRVPFEGHVGRDYDIVLRGERPILPGDPYSLFNTLVTRCWHQDPQERPTFANIVEDLKTSFASYAKIVEDFIDIDSFSLFNTLKTKCWAQEPGERPKFVDIVGDLKTSYASSAEIVEDFADIDSLSWSEYFTRGTTGCEG